MDASYFMLIEYVLFKKLSIKRSVWHFLFGCVNYTGIELWCGIHGAISWIPHQNNNLRLRQSLCLLPLHLQLNHIIIQRSIQTGTRLTCHMPKCKQFQQIKIYDAFKERRKKNILNVKLKLCMWWGRRAKDGWRIRTEVWSWFWIIQCASSSLNTPIPVEFHYYGTNTKRMRVWARPRPRWGWSCVFAIAKDCRLLLSAFLAFRLWTQCFAGCCFGLHEINFYIAV